MRTHFGHMSGKMVERDAADVILLEAGRQAQRLSGCRHDAVVHRLGRRHLSVGHPLE